MMMEGKDKPVDFLRVLEHIRAVSNHPNEDPMDAETIMVSTKELMASLQGPSLDFKQVRSLCPRQSW